MYDSGIRVQALTATYRPFWGKPFKALEDVSFVVDPGVTLGIVGSNGAGKTTLLRVLAGLIEPTVGDAKVLGIHPSKERVHLMSRVGVLLSGKRHFPERWLVQDALMYMGLLGGKTSVGSAGQVKKVAEVFNLQDRLEDQITTLSLGNRQRLSLASVFVHDPELVFLDEPTLALDTETTERFVELLKQRQKLGQSSLVISHDHGLLNKLVTEILELNQGKLMQHTKMERTRVFIEDAIPGVSRGYFLDSQPEITPQGTIRVQTKHINTSHNPVLLNSGGRK